MENGDRLKRIRWIEKNEPRVRAWWDSKPTLSDNISAISLFSTLLEYGLGRGSRLRLRREGDAHGPYTDTW